MSAAVIVVAHLAGVPVEELLPLAPATGALWLGVTLWARSRLARLRGGGTREAGDRGSGSRDR